MRTSHTSAKHFFLVGQYVCPHLIGLCLLSSCVPLVPHRSSTPPFLQFTSVELYQAYADYEDMMRLCEDVIRDCATQACGTLQVGSGRVQTTVNVHGSDLSVNSSTKAV